ncbi:MAG TPA: MurT ligase domain-containing protein [Ktedonobacterales bacterium]
MTPSPLTPPASSSAKHRKPHPVATRPGPRTTLAVLVGRATSATVRRLGIGGGTSLPGLIARGIDPKLTTRLSAQLRHGSIVVTGTNGKTTTSGMVGAVLRGAGMRVWQNREGSNLARGIATALLKHAHASGSLRDGGDAAFVFELDEAAFRRVLPELRPKVVLVTNLFRDQLDRYGEVDTVAERWREGLKRVDATTTLIANADDPSVAALADIHPGPVLFYGVNEAPSVVEGDARIQVIDTRTCPRCRGLLSYSVRYYSHVGHWSCTHCGFARPTPTVFASAVTLASLDGAQLTLTRPDGTAQARITLPGLYNVYNAVAAAAVGYVEGTPLSPAVEALARFSPAFGRAERIQARGRTVQILLAKNPTGLNEVLRALGADGRRHHLLMLLNDRAADGEDVSWIWDADFEQVPALAERVSAGGTRAFDMALRLKYAGLTPYAVESDIPKAFERALEATPVGESLYVIPTYTAMLAVRGELSRLGFAPRYWELPQDE